MKRPPHLSDYVLRNGTLLLTVTPLNVAGHGEYPTIWVARVDLDVPKYRTVANVARKHFGRRKAEAARAVAINRGHAMFIAAMVAGIR